MIEGTSVKDVESVTIPLEEYRVLVEVFTRVRIFTEYVQSEKYAIDRKKCGIFLKFEVDDGES